MQLLSNDPMAFARCMLGHTDWLGRHLLRSVRVSGLDIFWTVTADEASATAAGERIVSFRLTSCAAVLLWLVIRLLHRLWKDPQLQPAAKA